MSRLKTLPRWSVVLVADKNKKTPIPILVKKISSILTLTPEQIEEKIGESQKNGYTELVVTHLEKAELIQFLLGKVRVKSDLRRHDEATNERNDC